MMKIRMEIGEIENIKTVEKVEIIQKKTQKIN